MAVARYHIAALAAVVALTVEACAGGSGSGGSGGSGGEPHRQTTSPSASTPIGPTDSPAKESLEAVPAEKMLGIDRNVVRADDGTAVVLATNEFATRTTYRVYDRRWKPLTPVLGLRGHLIIERGLANAFVGRLSAYRTKRYPRVDEWVTVRSDGTLTAANDRAGRGSPPVHPRPGDRRLASVGSGRLVYRPVSRTVHKTDVPEWDVRRRAWFVTAAGDICALGSSDRIGATIHASVDEGRTFTDLSTAGLPVDSGPRVQSCETAGDRVAVMTGGEYPRRLHVLDRASGVLLASHDVGDQHGPYDPYGWRLLADGKLVVDTNRHGLYVATDSSNQILEFRPRPRVPYGSTSVVGDDLALLSGGRHMYVSSDEGRTWTRVDL